jgi:CheY-like chemotaxis protein
VSVLVVEDEAAVRRLVSRVLDAYGFAAQAAGAAPDAVRLAAQPAVRFDLLLTDVVLPGMTGRAVADAVLAHQPHCKVLFMSGYTDDAIVRHGVLDEGVAFIQKPFTADALVHKINEVLDSRSLQP